MNARRSRGSIGSIGSIGVMATAVAALVLAGCSSTAVGGPNDVFAAIDARQQAAQAAEVAAPAAAASVPAAAASCSPSPEASYPPLAALPAPGKMPVGSMAAAIQKRGYLVVGVSGDTRLLGARNSLADGELEGFDIELAKAVARAVFGADDDKVLRFRVITAGQRFEFANKGADNGGVDMVARAVSTTCDRWKNSDPTKGADFSAAYFKSAQLLLVRKDSKVTSIDQLKEKEGNRVCAPAGSTSLANLAKHKNVLPVSVEIHSDCLALWQEGRVDAITGDDAILAGFAAQDPRADVVGTTLDTTYYAFAIGRKHTDFVRFVNAVMAGPGFRTAWTQSYNRYLASPLQGQPQTQPAPNYNRPLSS